MCFWIGTNGSREYGILRYFLSTVLAASLFAWAKSFRQFCKRALWGSFLRNYFAFVPVLFDVTFVSHFISICRNTHPTSLFSWNLLIYYDFKLKYDILDPYTRIS